MTVKVKLFSTIETWPEESHMSTMCLFDLFNKIMQSRDFPGLYNCFSVAHVYCMTLRSYVFPSTFYVVRVATLRSVGPIYY